MPAAPSINYQLLANTYGFAYATLQHNSELKALFNNAIHGTKDAPGPWTPQMFQARLMATRWFRTTSDTAREWFILQQSDPKTALQRATARMQTIKDEAGALGVTLSSTQLKDFTNDSIMFGWTDKQVQATIGSAYHFTSANQVGLAATTIDQLRKVANDYLVPLSDRSLQGWVEPILQGTATPDAFAQYARNQAKSLFPTWGKEIDSGLTTQQLIDPYRQMAAQQLNLDPNTIDFTQSKWRSLIDSVDDKGQRAPLSLADAQTKVRTDNAYGFDSSQQGLQSAAQLTTAIGTRWGVVSG